MMTTMLAVTTSEFLQAFVALIMGGGLAGLLKVWTQRHKDEADAKQTSVNADISIVEGSKTVIASLTDEVHRLTTRSAELEKRLDSVYVELRTVERENLKLKNDVHELQNRCRDLESDLAATKAAKD